MVDLSTLWVFAQVFQNDLGRIVVGHAASLTVDTYLRGKTVLRAESISSTRKSTRQHALHVFA